MIARRIAGRLGGRPLVVALIGGVAIAAAVALPEPEPSLLALPPVWVESPLRLEPVVVSARAGHATRRRGRIRTGEAVRVELTAYCLRGTTRRGRYVRSGIVAADPRVFPLSRSIELFVAGAYYGRFLVDDTGKKIRGHHIDVWQPTCEAAVRFGHRMGTAVLLPRRR
ncbi:MAG: hypothetical protein NVS4B3_20790 [Gemmatimonadaceae bacterium]